MVLEEPETHLLQVFLLIKVSNEHIPNGIRDVHHRNLYGAGYEPEVKVVHEGEVKHVVDPENRKVLAVFESGSPVFMLIS